MDRSKTNPQVSPLGEKGPCWTPIGPRHLITLVLGTCFASTAIQWCWDSLVGSVQTIDATALDSALPLDMPIALLSLFVVKAAMTTWHPVFRLDVPAMWRTLVLDSTAP